MFSTDVDCGSSRWSRTLLGFEVLVALCLVALPGMVGSYWVYVLSLSFANGIGVLAVAFLTRYGGEISIGHNFFLAIGAYIVAVLTLKLGWPIPVAALLAIALCIVTAIAFAYPSRRLSGIYLALATMALGLAVPEIIGNFGEVTGGHEGLYVNARILGIFDPTIERYYLALAVLVLVVLSLYRLRHSSAGLRLLFARHSPMAAESFGTRSSWARISAMAISGALGGIAGVVFALVSSSVAPNGFSFWNAIYLLVGAVVSLHGLRLTAAVTGAAFITVLPELLASQGAWVPVIYGAVLLCVICISTMGDRLLSAVARLRRVPVLQAGSAADARGRT